jgi:hypothetical protein
MNSAVTSTTTLPSSSMATDDLAKALAGDLFSSLSTDSLDAASLMTLEKSRHCKHTIDQSSPLNSTDTFRLVHSMELTTGDIMPTSNNSLFSTLSKPALSNYSSLVSSSRSSESSMLNMLSSHDSSRQNDLYLCSANGGSDSRSMDETTFRTALHGEFPIKSRHRTTKRQYNILERQFRRNPRPDAATRDALAAKLSMRGRTVQIWFQNRRAKCKRDRERGRPAPPLPLLNDESDLCNNIIDDLNPVIDWDPAELDSEDGGRKVLLRDSSESSSSKLTSNPVSSISLNNVMMLILALSKTDNINDWMAEINLTGTESRSLAQQIAATNVSTAAYLNQLALSVSGATTTNSTTNNNDTMANLDQLTWWSGTIDRGQIDNEMSTPLVSSMLTDAVLLNQNESTNNCNSSNNSKSEDKQENCTIEQDIITTGLAASTNWLLESNIDCLTNNNHNEYSNEYY